MNISPKTPKSNDINCENMALSTLKHGKQITIHVAIILKFKKSSIGSIRLYLLIYHSIQIKHESQLCTHSFQFCMPDEQDRKLCTL